MKLFKILSAVALASLVACSPEFDYKVDPAETLELGTTSLSFLAENPATREVSVESSTSWTVSVDSLSQWIAVDVVEGGISITPENNPDIYERTGVITVKTGTRSVSIKVNQSALGVNFVADPDSVIVFPAEGGYFDVKINSNISWDATPSSAWAETGIITDFFSEAGEKTLRITLPARTIGDDASLKTAVGEIDFTHDNERIGRLKFSQKPVIPVITFSRDTVSVGASAFSETVSVESNWPFTCVSGAADSLWLSAVLPTPLPGETDETIYPAGNFSLTVNGLSTKPGREGTFTFATSDGGKFVLVVTQEGLPTVLTVTKNSISAPGAGTSDTFSLTTNNAWEILNAPSWATLSKTSGDEGTFEVTVTVAASTEKPRNATITVKSGDKTSDITLSQAGGPLDYYIKGTSAKNYIKGFTWQSSIANSYDLGPQKGYLASDNTMEFEFYAASALLVNGTSGIRMKTFTAGKSTNNAIGKKEKLAYIKFPAIDGYKLTKVKFNFYPSSATAVWPAFFSPTLGEDIEDAKKYAVSDVNFVFKPSAIQEITLNKPAANTAYYLMLTDTVGSEYQFNEIWFYYDPAE